MIEHRNKISNVQLVAILLLDVFCIALFTLPHVAANLAGADGWMLIVGAAVVITGFAAIIHALCVRFPGMGFHAFSREILGRVLAAILSIAFAIKLVLGAGLLLRQFAALINQTTLIRTPQPVVIGAMVLVAAYAAYKGIEARARLSEILIWFVFVPLLIVMAVAATRGDFSRLQPAFQTPPQEILTGSLRLLLFFQGLEILLLIYPYLTKPTAARKYVFSGIGILGILMIILTIVTFAVASPAMAARTTWPVWQIVDSINIPESFAERQGALLIAFFVILSFSFINSGLFFSKKLLSDTFNIKKCGPLLIIVSLAVFAIAAAPLDAEIAEILAAVLNFSFGALFALLPIFLLVIAIIKKRLFGKRKI